VFESLPSEATKERLLSAEAGEGMSNSAKATAALSFKHAETRGLPATSAVGSVIIPLVMRVAWPGKLSPVVCGRKEFSLICGLTMKVDMEVHRLRAGIVALALLSVLFAAGCGAEARQPDAAATSGESGRPDAETTTEATEVTKPAKAETLRLLEDGNPTVFVRLKEEVDLYDEPRGNVVETVGHFTSFGSRTVYAVTGQKDDWASVLTPYAENGKPLWLELDPERLKVGRSIWDIEVDLSEFETRVYEEGELVRSFPVSVGMPTAPTPTGSFAVTDTFRGGLNAAYGCCAVATTGRQVNLPSGWLGGDRIAIHGTTGPLGVENSHGCVRAVDEDVSALVDMVPPGTPVEIHE